VKRIILSKESKEFKDAGGRIMELSRISSKGQVTIPIDIRKKLSLKEGDKVLFMEEEGKVFIANASLVALSKIQTAMEGEAEKAGLKTEQDVVDFVKSIRKELWEKNYANND
jgi:AbrB family looped-hinge helix DNA binding protein